METSPLALPVGSLLMIAFGLTALLVAAEGFVAHAFYGALRSQEVHGYTPLGQRPTDGCAKEIENVRATLANNVKMTTIHETPGGVGTGMRIDPFVQGMQSRMESAHNSIICLARS
jgi:hypothetical protein